ncbi:unnamed protein product [Hymenolepis diminuta]|uniref:EF-hand domain-containing protein n=1 Tax=Hymenolepis diminuta TaxID=6216 RepID=A0A0R3SB22_HYMDI|nr:unnamed protein product [Hymenolepis diminuta]
MHRLAPINVKPEVGVDHRLQNRMPMFLAGQESGRHYLALKSVDRYKNTPFLTSSFLTATVSLWNIHFLSRFSNLWHYFNDFWEAPSVRTINFSSERYRDGGVMSQNRIYFSSILVLILFLSSLVPTVSAVGLGLNRQQQSSHQRQPQDPPFYDPARTGAESVSSNDDSTIVVRTREASAPTQQPPQPFGGPVISPYQYNVPPMNPGPQQPLLVPVYYPNYKYYPVYGGSWVYPETRRNLQQNRQKNGNRRRKERQRGGKCPKVCDTCIRTHDLDQERENDELQRRFAFHVKPSLHDMDSVEALFKYMDGNNDGSISLTELQNYLLLHNIISPEAPK